MTQRQSKARGKTWGLSEIKEDEIVKAEQEDREPDRRKRCRINDEPPRRSPWKKVCPWKDAIIYSARKARFYLKHLLKELNMNELTIYLRCWSGSACPGQLLHVTTLDPIETTSFPLKGHVLRISNRIYIKTPRNDEINTRFGKCSLMTPNYERFLETLVPWLNLTAKF